MATSPPKTRQNETTRSSGCAPALGAAVTAEEAVYRVDTYEYEQKTEAGLSAKKGAEIGREGGARRADEEVRNTEKTLIHRKRGVSGTDEEVRNTEKRLDFTRKFRRWVIVEQMKK
jgi:hypothetical protein